MGQKMKFKRLSKLTLLSLGLAFQPVTAQAEIQEPTPVSASDEGLSSQARAALGEIRNRGYSDFIVVDKNRARIHIFDEGQEIATAPVLLGKQKGDDLGSTDEPSWNRPVTPAGHFSIQLYRDEEAYKSYGTNTLLHFICNRERTLCTSLHQTWTAVQSENRPQRLLSPTSADNYISNGCVNIDAQTWRTVLNLARENRNGGSSNIHMTDVALFILPEDESRTMEYLGFSRSSGYNIENQAQIQASLPS
ncbi:MAG: hypothetical protein CL565_05960 [Alphaproteobacteria bacterium]|nr:hypothetical protein [Alphaproteobacteria bacterium]|tara:strand:- start:714 stop:1460 length:747 start_codon:yes stop_codon:yes gene_type:complete